MPWRCQFGERNGAFGGWVSKPGYDVTTASPGQFLVDTTSQVYQRVARGSTLIVSGPSVGTYTASVTLDSIFASYSNLATMATLQQVDDSGNVNFDHVWEGLFRLRQHVASGVLYFRLDVDLALSSGAHFWANWWVFRGQY